MQATEWSHKPKRPWPKSGKKLVGPGPFRNFVFCFKPGRARAEIFYPYFGPGRAEISTTLAGRAWPELEKSSPCKPLRVRENRVSAPPNIFFYYYCFVKSEGEDLVNANIIQLSTTQSISFKNCYSETPYIFFKEFKLILH